MENVPISEDLGMTDMTVMRAMTQKCMRWRADMQGEGHSLKTGGKVGGGLELHVIKLLLHGRLREMSSIRCAV